MMTENIGILSQILLSSRISGLELMEVNQLSYWELIIEEGDLLPKIVDQRT